MKHEKAIHRIGESNQNKYGSTMIIDEYNSAHDIWVKFTDNGNRVHTAYHMFKKGSVANVYDKTYFGLGFIGEGKYKIKDNEVTRIYNTWSNMFKRCYDNKFHERQPTYKSCSVSKEWYCFQDFAAWYNENYYEIKDEKMQLDKDILSNKVYSPETCVFVPKIINNLFVKTNAKRGKLPLGVYWNKDKNKYQSYYQLRRIHKKLGYHDTVEEAFQSYKEAKERIIKEIANEYREKIPLKLYIALMNYIVEITD
jgi:hypothetical protein